MCSPGLEGKTNEQLASAARTHYKAYETAKQELERRGYNVSIITGHINITRTVKEAL